MNIAIVENERKEVEGAFDYANLKYFNSLLSFHYFETSQSFLKSPSLDDFSLILVDISLSFKSHMDGFGLIKTILERNPSMAEKIAIITGNNKVKERAIELGFGNIPIIYKPTRFQDINSVFQSKGIKAEV